MSLISRPAVRSAIAPQRRRRAFATQSLVLLGVGGLLLLARGTFELHRRTQLLELGLLLRFRERRDLLGALLELVVP